MQNERVKSIAELAPKVLTALQEPSTKACMSNTIYERFKRNAPFKTLNDPQLIQMLEASAKFAASVNFTEPYWLTLSGSCGIGKSLLAKAVKKQFIEQNRFEYKFNEERRSRIGNTMIFCDWRKLCDDIRAGDFELVDDICEEWFVVLDDIGTEYDPNGFVASKLDRILNSRQGKWTMITVNLSLQQISEKLDPRIASRMLRDGGVVVETIAPDYNLRT